jgi:hypothetical protein
MSYGVMAELSRHGSKYVSELPWPKIYVHTLPFFALNRSQAQRQAKCSPPPPTRAIQLARTPKTKPSAAARPSATEKGYGGLPRLRHSNSHARRRRPSRAQRLGRAKRRRGFGVSSDYDTTQHAHTQKKAERSGQAERSREGEFRSPPPDYGNPTRAHAKEGQAERSGKGGFGALP